MRLRLALATGFGAGYAPIAPGTVGSLPGLLLVWLLAGLGGHLAAIVGLVVVVLLGVWAADAAVAHFGKGDPGQVVIDEIAGQMLTLLFVPLSPATLVLGFLLFRLLDVVKPPPVRWLETLPRGAGIMADDLMAGAYANLLLQAVRWSGLQLS